MLINLTPWDVNVAGICIPPTGKAIRVNPRVEDYGAVEYEGTLVPVTCRIFREPPELPAAQPGVFLIVMGDVANACPGRRDLLTPGKRETVAGEIRTLTLEARWKNEVKPILPPVLLDREPIIQSSEEESPEVAVPKVPRRLKPKPGAKKSPALAGKKRTRKTGQ